jgi:hypothetical protein
MGVIKVASGDWSSNTYRTDGKNPAVVADPLVITLSDDNDADDNDATHSEVTIVIQSPCKVLGVYLFNAEDDEVLVQLLDVKPNSTNTYDNVVDAGATKAPVMYSTIVPRDAAITQTLAGVLTLAMDLYDSPSGIYHEFPKPGFNFENGVGVHYKVGIKTQIPLVLEGDANPEVFWVIFYTEVG